MASRWRSDYNGIFIFICVQTWILIERVKSGADRLLHGELQQLLFPWRDIEICDAAKDTPISENSSSSQFNITKAFRLN